MILKRIECKPFNRAYDFSVSSSYIVGCTGRRAHILNRNYSLQQSIEGLSYVYSAYVSPDEQKLLLVSNENKFYVVDLKSQEMQKVTVKSPYNDNLDGRGCWSFDGESVFVIVRNSKNQKSTLRQYSASDLTTYVDVFKEEYYFQQIQRLEKQNRYLLFGSQSTEENACYYLFYFDGNSLMKYPLEKSEEFEPIYYTIDERTRNVILYSYREQCYIYSEQGKLLEMIEHPKPKKDSNSSSYELPEDFKNNSDIMKAIEEMHDIIGECETEDNITKYATSMCGQYCFLSSNGGFYVLDAKREEILAQISEEYGVQNFEQLEEDMIAISTWNGVKIYKICEGVASC